MKLIKRIKNLLMGYCRYRNCGLEQCNECESKEKKVAWHCGTWKRIMRGQEKLDR